MWKVTGALMVLVLIGTGVAAAGPGPGKLYVADEDTDSISVIETTNWRRVTVVPLTKSPHDVQVSADGKLVWVTSEYDRRKLARLEHRQASELGRGELSAIDTGTDHIVARILVGRRPAHVVLTPDGQFAYVTNSGDNTVSVVDTRERRVVGTIPVDAYPHGIRIDPNRREAYVANLRGDTVSIIDIDTREAVAQIPVGKGPAEVAFTPNGRLAFVSLRDENAVAVIDSSKRAVVQKVVVGPVPAQLAVTPDSRSLLVVNHGSRKTPGAVSFIDLATLTVSARLEVGVGAHGIAVSEDGRFAYVTSTHANWLSAIEAPRESTLQLQHRPEPGPNSVAVIDLVERKVIATALTGRGPHGVGVKP
jgi:YVTN family beta-propeller protein